MQINRKMLAGVENTLYLCIVIFHSIRFKVNKDW